MQTFIEKVLNQHKDETYKDFSMRLLPGIDNILGVRIPILRQIASNMDEKDLIYLDNSSFESVMLRGLIITGMDESNGNRMNLVDSYVHQLDNWSHCDTFCKYLNGIKIDVLIDYAFQNSEFVQRFALVMFIEHCLVDESIDLVISVVEHMQPRGYYSQMALGWLIASAYVDYPTKVEHWLKTSTHHDKIINLSLRKIRESNRIDKDAKKRLMKFKRLRSSTI